MGGGAMAGPGPGGMAGPGPGGIGGDEGQLPPELLQAMQRGMDEEMLLADMLGNIPADEAAELQRLVQEGDLQMLSCSQVLLLSCCCTLLFSSCRASAPCARR